MLPDLASSRGGQDANPPALTRTPATTTSPLIPTWLSGVILLVAILLAYQPAWRAGFIWDDDEYVVHNDLLTAPDGLKRIWFSLDSPSQYFPLLYTALRFERALWGLNAAGYHWVNLLLHVANALLVWLLMRRLKVPGAWLAAALFALHPVQVESVAWITEQKNVLSLFFCLLSALAWVEFVEERPGGSGRHYLAALVFYGLALLSKTTACTLPAAFLLILWLKKRPLSRARLLQIAPFVVLALGMGLLTMWWERHHQGTVGRPFAMGFAQRLLIASRALWFYAGKLAWPAHLTFSYPRWSINPSNPLAYGWLAAGMGLLGMFWWARRFIGRGLETAVWFYIATLSPLLGFIMLYTFRYTYVADHYQYMACIGPLALVAASLERMVQAPGRGILSVQAACCGALLLVLGTLTWRQCGMYRDVETLWQETLVRNPASYLAHNSLGVLRMEQGKLDQAFAQFQKSLQIEAANPEALNDLGAIELRKGDLSAAADYFQKAVRVKPDYAGAYYNLGLVSIQTGHRTEAIAYFEKALEIYPPYADAHDQLGRAFLQEGRYADALAQFQAALALEPGNPYLLNNAAWVLATCPEPKVRSGSKALPPALEAVRLTGGTDADLLETLAAAYADLGRFPQAVATIQHALDIATARHDVAGADRFRAQLRLYQASKTFRSDSK